MTVSTDSSGLWVIGIVLACIFFVGDPDLVDALVCHLMDNCETFQPEKAK